MRISLEEALDILMDHISPGKVGKKPLEDCLGLVLSEDVDALLDMPPFSRSAQDGYALLSKDSVGAGTDTPVKLKVTGKIYAGDHLDVQVRPGEAVRIMTGAMIPAGADCVLRQEDTDEGEDIVQIYKEVEPGCSICFKGEEYKKAISCFMQAQRSMRQRWQLPAETGSWNCLCMRESKQQLFLPAAR